MRSILLALSLYDATFQTLPPVASFDSSGRPLSSWRFRLIPFLTSMKHDAHWDKAWNADENEFWSNSSLDNFCWSDSTNTNVFAIVGPGMAFDPTNANSMSKLDQNCIMLIEVSDTKTHWMEPGDLDVATINGRVELPNVALGSPEDGKGFFVGFADGDVWLISQDVPREILERFFFVDATSKRNRENLLGPFREN